MDKLVRCKSLGLLVAAVLVTGCQGNTNHPMGGMFQSLPLPNSTSMGMNYQGTPELAVQDALMRTGDPILAQVKVSTEQNVVVLSGYVKKIRQSDTAEQIARQTPGVQNVENRLIVRQ